MYLANNKTKNNLRILFLSSDKYPIFRPAARAIFGEEMLSRGAEIDWILQAEYSTNKSEKITFGNGSVYVGATDNGELWTRRLKKHFLDIFNDFRVFKLLKQGNYDLIQVKDKYVSAVLALLAARFFGVKYFYWLAYPHPEASFYTAKAGIARYRFFSLLRGHVFKFLLYRIIIPYSDHTFVQSEQMKKDIAKEGIPYNKMTPIPGSVNLKDIPFDNHSKDFIDNPALGEKWVIYLGTLNRTRKLDFLLRTFTKVLTKHPNAKLYILGKGDMPEDESFLKGEVERLGIGCSVVFKGYLPMDIAWEYIRNASVCVSPYYPTPILNSTSPTKLIEYMAMGKATVANIHPEQKLVISESGAGLCVPWDESMFADAIVTLLSENNLASAMGGKGREYVEKFRTNKHMADLVESVYRNNINK